MSTIDLTKYKLIIFDMDGTLADRDTAELLPRVAEWFYDQRHSTIQYAIATNQGGVGLRYWMEKEGFGEPEKFPTTEDVRNHIAKVIHAIIEPLRVAATDSGDRVDVGQGDLFKVFVAFRYQSRKGNWSPLPENLASNQQRFWQKAWRKPGSGMLISAMKWAGVSPENTLMVGDRDEDRLAAEAAGCDFIHADIFFGRTQP